MLQCIRLFSWLVRSVWQLFVDTELAIPLAYVSGQLMEPRYDNGTPSPTVTDCLPFCSLTHVQNCVLNPDPTT